MPGLVLFEDEEVCDDEKDDDSDDESDDLDVIKTGICPDFKGVRPQ